jgi:hypothetical protein
MRKTIVLGSAGIVAVAAAAAVFLAVNKLDGVVGDAVATYGRAATDTDVDVGGVDIALTEGTGKLTRLTVDNPPGFETGYAVRVNDVEVSLDLRSLSSGVPVVTELLLDDAHINAEHRGDATNLTEIQRNVSQPSTQPAAPAEDAGRIIIDRFRLTNARVTVTSELFSKPEELALEDVVVTGIGRSAGGASYAEAAEAMLAPILAAARSAAQARLQSEAADAVRGELEEEIEEKAGEKLRELLDRDRP